MSSRKRFRHCSYALLSSFSCRKCFLASAFKTSGTQKLGMKSVAFCDLSAVLGQPCVTLVEQLKRALDYFIGTLVGAGTQRLGNKLLVFRPQSDGHPGLSFSLLHFHRTPAHGSGQACELLVIR